MRGRRKTKSGDEDFGPSAGSGPKDLFSWVVKDRVIGMGRPSSEDLAALASCGVSHVISLTVQPMERELLNRHGITGIHIPVMDMSAPSPAEITRFVEELARLVDEGHKVAVHCGAGLGRTGTMLACYLVSRGMSADEALSEVRSQRPGSVESRVQEEAVREFERFIGA
jgi:atypical dual specificity phosphatase